MSPDENNQQRVTLCPRVQRSAASNTNCTQTDAIRGRVRCLNGYGGNR